MIKNSLFMIFSFYSVAGFEMKLSRHISHYLITYYLPSGEFKYKYKYKYKYSLNSKSTTTTYILSLGEDNSLYTSEVLIFFFSGLFVVVSWISFVVPPEVIPGRMVRKMIPEQMVKKIIPGRMVKIILSCSNANCRQTLQKIK